MSKKIILQRKRLAAIYASFAILIVGAASLFRSMSLDYYSVLSTVEKVLPASVAFGCLGWIMGLILDRPKKRNGIGYNTLFLNEIIKNASAEKNLSEGLENSEESSQ